MFVIFGLEIIHFHREEDKIEVKLFRYIMTSVNVIPSAQIKKLPYFLILGII